MKRILIAAFVVIFVGVVSFIYFNNNEVKTGVKGLEDKTLTVGMECAYAPYNWTTPNSTKTSSAISGGFCDGYDVMIAQKLADYLNVELKISPISWDGLIPAVQSNNIDVIIAGMSPTSERKTEIDFSDSYFTEKVELGVVVNKSTKYASSTDLNGFEGAKISSQLGTFHSELISQLNGAQKENELESFDALVRATNAKTIDGFISEKGVAEEIINANANLMYINETKYFKLTEEQNTVAIGVSKENKELTTLLNEGLSTISNTQRTELMNNAINSNEGKTPVEESGAIVNLWNFFINNKDLYITGIKTTLILAIFGTFFGLIIGCVLAAMRISKIHYKDSFVTKTIKRTLNYISLLYIDIIRGTPMMVQAMLFFYGVVSGWMDVNTAGIIIISFNTGAYIGEILRGGILSIDKGQSEAARSLGFSNTQTLIKVVIPQAIKNTLPSLGNELIVNVKDSSVLSAIGVTELFFMTKSAASVGYKYTEAYIVTAIIYLIMTIVLSRLLSLLVRKIFKSNSGDMLGSDSVKEIK